ncbi:unnamed protein product [Aspergillus oryzae RIB40]|uniref:DNA, SC001 n=2 Tax=Aspergillus oryzae TaxID=5062 RepID=Q2UMY9_ASPOR|nr:unnamed protein product [Aspergillus oryzae RIB40]BAE57076.1 unnamed protein product [Aspergillus oryzae RIB40]GMG03033.1 unnamed protein product [Aspergillus oryzae]GMG50899.1 unnamed protein product [Aspergillus oryzae var. brunneus]
MANIIAVHYNLDQKHTVKIESLPTSIGESKDGINDISCNLSPPASTYIEASMVDGIYKLLKEVESPEFDTRWQETPSKALSPSAQHAASTYRKTLCLGLRCLSGEITIPNNQTWNDAIAYCRAVIAAPQDSITRASSYWIRSSSDISKVQLQRFGPGIIAAAHKGNYEIVSDHFQGDRLKVPHIDKKQSFYRNARNMDLGAFFYPSSSPLAVGAFDSGIVPCSLSISAFLDPEAAVKGGSISGVAICDDYAAFSREDYEIRLRIVGFALGCAYEFGGQLVNAITDGSMLQCVGTGDQHTLEAAMAWRVISGCTSPNSGYIFGKESLEEGLVITEVEIAIHDLLDWRSDVAAGNHENGVSAAYGLGIEDPFHAYLEATLERAVSNPRSGGYAIAAIVYMHFTGVRYGAYDYHGTHGESCSECVRILRDVTIGAGLVWAPKSPPRSFEGSAGIRQLGKTWIDEFKDCGLVQESLGWFQHLVSTGEIRLFDVLNPIKEVDTEADWA